MEEQNQARLIKMITSTSCRICRSRHRAEIDRMLLDGEQLTQVSRHIYEKYGVKYSPSAISKHFRNHVEKVLTQEALDRYEKKVQNTIDELEFLDFLRQAAYDAIKEGRIEVSAYEALKATEVKLKFTQEAPGVTAFLEMLQSLTRVDDERLKDRRQGEETSSSKAIEDAE